MMPTMSCFFALLVTLLACESTLAPVPRAAAPAATGVYTSGLYKKLAPLATCPAAKAFCSKAYPSTVPVTKGGKVKRSTTTSKEILIPSDLPLLTSCSDATSTTYHYE